jgi:rRNA maturation RNase YbeY
VAREIDLLFLHGLLHLLGYEDETPEERARMWARQEELLGALS